MSIRIVFPTTIVFALAGGAVAQPSRSAADGPWSGQVQCVLSARGPTYQDEQTHTWRITGGPPQLSGVFRRWPAVWSVEGRGGGSVVGGASTWLTNVPETSAPVSISAAEGRIRIASQHGLLVANGGMTIVNTTTNQRSPASLEEWVFPVIDDDASKTTISGTRSRPTPSYSRGWRQPSDVTTQETCTWNFTRGGAPTTTDTGRAGQPPELVSRSGLPTDTGARPPQAGGGTSSGGANTPVPTGALAARLGGIAPPTPTTPVTGGSATPAAGNGPPTPPNAVSVGQAWLPTIDGESRYPPGLPAAQRARVLASLDPLLAVVRSALDTQGVKFRAQRGFADEPQLPQGPFPLNLYVQGFEQQADGEFEGEAATNINLFVNDLKPLLSIAQDEPRVWLLKADGVRRGAVTVFEDYFTLVSKGGVVPLRAVSKEEYARRVEVRLTRQRNEKTLAQLRADLAALSPAQRAEPMLLPRAHTEDKAWPGFNGGVRPVVDIDPAYFDLTRRDVPQVILLGGSVNRGLGHERAMERLQEFGRTLDYEGLRAQLR